MTRLEVCAELQASGGGSVGALSCGSTSTSSLLVVDGNAPSSTGSKEKNEEIFLYLDYYKSKKKERQTDIDRQI